MAQLKEAIFGVDPVEVVRGDPQVDLEKVIEHDLLDSPSRDNSFAPSLIPNEEEARLSLEISESQPPMEVEDQATNPPPASHSSPADTEELHFDEEDHSLNNLPVIQVILSYTPFLSSVSFLHFLNHVLSLSRRRASLELPLCKSFP